MPSNKKKQPRTDPPCSYARLARTRGMVHLAAECGCPECDKLLGPPYTYKDKEDEDDAFHTQ
jgi:hypothetical protein